MKLKITLMSAACVLALAACGNDDAAAPTATTPDTAGYDATTAPGATPGTAQDGTTPDTAAGTTAGTDTGMGTGTTAAGDSMTTTGGAGTSTGAAGSTAGATGAGSDQPEAVVKDCTTVIEGTDTMRFSVGSITVPASCSEFTITLNHIGQLPEAAMGHNVVITAASDLQAVAAAAISAGAGANYVPPNDDRVIAASEMIGGGESTSVTFPVSRLQQGGPYEFFCSFPGHSAIMRGTISVG